MKAGLHIEQMLHELFAEKVSIKEKRGVGGGCINQTSVLLLSNGRKLFLKENSLTYEGLFSSERAGLIALRSEQGPRIPEPYAVGKGGGRQFLLLEYIEPGSKASDFWEEFGRLLAGLHRGRHEGRFGFGQDNYIGASPQKNSWESEWPRFFAEHRLRFQLELARSRGHSNERWMRGLEGIIERIEELLPHPEHPSLLHGDLWGGNYMVDERGRAVLIDPAVYYGDREADLAMTERVLDNLIDNAVAHVPDGGTIELGAAADDERLKITVADNGPGIPDTNKADLFEPFTRGNTGEARGHAGLGLAIARRLMDLQGGGLTVHDREPAGVEFVVTLPLDRHARGDVMKS